MSDLEKNENSFAEREAEIVKSILSNAKSEDLIPKNGLARRDDSRDFRALDNCGINFIAELDGVIHGAWVYADKDGMMGAGLAEQPDPYAAAGEEIYYKTFPMKRGWNHLELNFTVEKGKRYILFKRIIQGIVYTDSKIIKGWATNPELIRNGLDFRCESYLDGRGVISNYCPFFEIEFVTKLDQIYKLLTEKFYIGNTPYESTEYWFKPVGGETNE